MNRNNDNENRIEEFFMDYDAIFQKDFYDEQFKQYCSYVQVNLTFEEIESLAVQIRKFWNCQNISASFFHSILQIINKPNVHYTMKSYAREMALNSFRKAKEVNREGKAYKELISNMYFLDDDLKNDTIQFDLAVERFRINSNEIDNQLNRIKYAIRPSIYDIEKFSKNTEYELPLSNRFDDLQMNVNSNNV